MLFLFLEQAMLINFNPLTTEDVTLPSGCAFVVTHSLTEVNKAATDHFNIRVSECRLATQVCLEFIDKF